MIKLTKRQIIRLHEQLIKETGGIMGLRDEKLFESAIETRFSPLAVMIYIRAYRPKRPDYAMDW